MVHSGTARKGAHSALCVQQSPHVRRVALALLVCFAKRVSPKLPSIKSSRAHCGLDQLTVLVTKWPRPLSERAPAHPLLVEQNCVCACAGQPFCSCHARYRRRVAATAEEALRTPVNCTPPRPCVHAIPLGEGLQLISGSHALGPECGSARPCTKVPP